MGLFRPSKAELLLRIQELETAMHRVVDEHAALKEVVQGPPTLGKYHYALSGGLLSSKPVKAGLEGEVEALEAFIKACIQSVRDDIREHVESRVLHPELKERDDLEAKAKRFTVLAEEIK